MKKFLILITLTFTNALYNSRLDTQRSHSSNLYRDSVFYFHSPDREDSSIPYFSDENIENLYNREFEESYGKYITFPDNKTAWVSSCVCDPAAPFLGKVGLDRDACEITNNEDTLPCFEKIFNHFTLCYYLIDNKGNLKIKDKLLIDFSDFTVPTRRFNYNPDLLGNDCDWQYNHQGYEIVDLDYIDNQKFLVIYRRIKQTGNNYWSGGYELYTQTFDIDGNSLSSPKLLDLVFYSPGFQKTGSKVVSFKSKSKSRLKNGDRVYIFQEYAHIRGSCYSLCNLLNTCDSDCIDYVYGYRADRDCNHYIVKLNQNGDEVKIFWQWSSEDLKGDNNNEKDVNAFELFLKEPHDIRPLSNDGYVVLLPTPKNCLYVIIADNYSIKLNPELPLWYSGASNWYNEIFVVNDINWARAITYDGGFTVFFQDSTQLSYINFDNSGANSGIIKFCNIGCGTEWNDLTGYYFELTSRFSNSDSLYLNLNYNFEPERSSHTFDVKSPFEALKYFTLRYNMSTYYNKIYKKFNDDELNRTNNVYTEITGSDKTFWFKKYDITNLLSISQIDLDGLIPVQPIGSPTQYPTVVPSKVPTRTPAIIPNRLPTSIPTKSNFIQDEEDSNESSNKNEESSNEEIVIGSIGIVAGIILLIGCYYISKNVSFKWVRDVTSHLELKVGKRQQEVYEHKEESKEYESDSDLSV